MVVGSTQRRKGALKPKPGQLRFLRERSAWPFVHAIIPLALYAISRNLTLSLLLIYVWESVETIFSLFGSLFSEDKPDSLIGDPIVGSLAIFTLYVLDCTFGWRTVFCDSVPLALRLGAFAVLGLISALAFAYTPHNFNLTCSFVWVVPVMTLLYAATILVFFNRIIFRPQTAVEMEAGTSTLVWLLLASIFAAAATLSPPRTIFLSSTFVRVVAAELFVLITVLVVRTAHV